MSAGISQPGGAGTTIYVYDNAHADAGGDGSYSFADIKTAMDILVPGQTDFVATGTTPETYKAVVSIQIGDIGTGTALTTLQDTNVCVKFDVPLVRTLLYRTTQTTSWTTNLGTKVGSGDKAATRNGCDLYFGSNVIFRGNYTFYGCRFVGAASINFAFVTGVTQDIQGCNVGSTAITNISPITIGSAGTSPANVYNCDFWANTSGNIASVFATFKPATAELIVAGGPSIAGIMRIGTIVYVAKDLIMYGAPSLGDIVYTSPPINPKLIRPQWTGNAPKFGGGLSLTLANATWEYRLYDVKVVDSNGAAIAGIPVKLTDVLGNVVVNTTSNSTGGVDFGTGLLTNAIVVADHWSSGGVYTESPRGPFFAEINTGAGANTNYLARRYYFDWPVASSGVYGVQYDDVADIVAIEDQSGQPTTWTEATL